MYRKYKNSFQPSLTPELPPPNRCIHEGLLSLRKARDAEFQMDNRPVVESAERKMPVRRGRVMRQPMCLSIGSSMPLSPTRVGVRAGQPCASAGHGCREEDWSQKILRSWLRTKGA